MTAQIPESLSFEGQNLHIFAEPLRPWLALRRNKSIRFKRRNSALGRGYIGHWEVIDGRLYLVGIEGKFSDDKDATIADLFPESPERVFAAWFTGELRCPRGKMLGYSHAGYSSIYESDLFLRFEKGICVEQRTVTNQPPAPDEFDSAEG